MSGPSLKDVPDRYDVVFQLNDGSTYGFLLADSVESNLPFRTHKALYSYSPTFLERQNVSNVYGDNFQDFFLTGSQDDFSLGQDQKFFRVNDADRSRRYWADTGVDPTTVPGNVTLSPNISASATTAAAAICSNSDANRTGTDWWLATSANLYSCSGASATLIGAHGCTGPLCMTMDLTRLYIAGSAGIRKYDGLSFSTFSTKANITAMVYLNNILFGYQESSDSLISFDTSGNPTTQFQWEGADGTTGSLEGAELVAYGGSIYILRYGPRGVELWQYDGNGCLMLAEFPRDFFATNLTVSNGVVFIVGAAQQTTSKFYPQVYYYVNGSLGKLWDSPNPTSPSTGYPNSIEPFGNGVVFIDPSTMNLLQYDISLGGVHTIANLSGAGMSASDIIFLYASTFNQSIMVWSDTGGKFVVWARNNNYPSSGYIQTSQYDFDNTLTKIIRGIKVDADIPANTSVDIAYQLDGCGGSYTTLQTGVTSGQEYLLPASTSAHSVSVQVTLNSSTGTATPTLKRVYVRAAPLLDQFRKREYLFDLSGGVRENLGLSARQCRDGTVYPYDPITAANNLKKVALQTVPYTVVDKFGLNPGFTVLADLEQNQEGYDGFAIYEVRPDVYIGRINVREV